MADAKHTEPDTLWMTPQEVWVWEQVKAGERAYLWDMPQDVRDRAGDGDKEPVEDPLKDGDDGERVRVDEAAWPEWQKLTADFIERLVSHKAFIAARRRNQVEIEGARIIGSVRLHQAEIPGDLCLDHCRFDDAPELYGARIGGVFSLQGSHLAADLYADRMDVGGGVFLRGGARFDGAVRLLGAKIAGGLECDGSHFRAGADGVALNADGMEMGGDVFLTDGARFEGEVRLLGAKIMGDLACIGSHFRAGADGKALSADAMEVGGAVFLRDGARFEGRISLTRASVGSVMQLSGSRFDGTLNFSGLTVTGEILLDETKGGMEAPEWGKKAELNLINARIGALHGSAEAWQRNGKFIPLHLDGLKIERLAGGDGGDSLDTEDAETIIQWVEAGSIDRENKDRGFAQSPYITVANALEASGALDRARAVRIALEKRKTKSMVWYSPRKWFRTLLSWINSYGYRPYQGFIIAIVGVVLFASAGFIWSEGGLQNALAATCADWREPLYWLGFSLEQMIPFVELDPINDFFLESQFGDGPNQYGYADPSDVPFLARGMFMFERFMGVVILSFSLAGITAWAERRSN